MAIFAVMEVHAMWKTTCSLVLPLSRRGTTQNNIKQPASENTADTKSPQRGFTDEKQQPVTGGHSEMSEHRLGRDWALCDTARVHLPATPPTPPEKRSQPCSNCIEWYSRVLAAQRQTCVIFHCVVHY